MKGVEAASFDGVLLHERPGAILAQCIALRYIVPRSKFWFKGCSEQVCLGRVAQRSTQRPTRVPVMTQLNFGDAAYAGKRKRNKREIFLTELEQVKPWSPWRALSERWRARRGGKG